MEFLTVKPNGIDVLKRDLTIEMFHKDQLEALCKPIPIREWNNKNLQKQWESLARMFFNEKWEQEKIEVSYNATKMLNRYGDIRPYAYNCVRLNDKSADDMESYINADYINNIYDPTKQSAPEFIATQGPVQRSYWSHLME